MSGELLVKLNTDNNTFKNICSIDKEEGENICLSDNIINKINTLIIPSNKENICNKDDLSCVKEKKKEIIDNLINEFECKKDGNEEICIINKSNERNILNKEEVNEIKFKHFKPFASKNPIDWLSNDDIDTVQEQLYKKYKNIKN